MRVLTALCPALAADGLPRAAGVCLGAFLVVAIWTVLAHRYRGGHPGTNAAPPPPVTVDTRRGDGRPEFRLPTPRGERGALVGTRDGGTRL